MLAQLFMGAYGSAESKVKHFAKAGVAVAKSPAQIPKILADRTR